MFGLPFQPSVSGGLGAAPRVAFSAPTTYPDSASAGDLIALMGVAGVDDDPSGWTFALTDDAGARVAIDGVDNTRLEVGATTPVSGGYSFTVRATKGGAPESPIDTTRTLTITVPAPIAAGALADQTFNVGAPVSFDVSADFTGSGVTYALAPASAALPDGLSLSGAGVISGTPTTEAGAMTIVVRGTNSGGSDDTAFNVTVAAASTTPAILQLSSLVFSGDSITNGQGVSASERFQNLLATEHGFTRTNDAVPGSTLSRVRITGNAANFRENMGDAGNVGGTNNLKDGVFLNYLANDYSLGASVQECRYSTIEALYMLRFADGFGYDAPDTALGTAGYRTGGFGGGTQAEYETIPTIQREIANNFGVYLFDMFAVIEADPVGLLGDEVHPNAAGHIALQGEANAMTVPTANAGITAGAVSSPSDGVLTQAFTKNSGFTDDVASYAISPGQDATVFAEVTASASPASITGLRPARYDMILAPEGGRATFSSTVLVGGAATADDWSDDTSGDLIDHVDASGDRWVPCMQGANGVAFDTGGGVRNTGVGFYTGVEGRFGETDTEVIATMARGTGNTGGFGPGVLASLYDVTCVTALISGGGVVKLRQILDSVATDSATTVDISGSVADGADFSYKIVSDLTGNQVNLYIDTSGTETFGGTPDISLPIDAGITGGAPVVYSIANRTGAVGGTINQFKWRAV